MYTLITDGAYSFKTNKGGVGLVFLKDDKLIAEFSKGYENSTNNIMEVSAIIIGLRMIKKPIDKLVIKSDSMYAIGQLFKNWKRNKNKKLLELADSELARVRTLCSDIEYVMVKGHSGDYWNEYVDKLAVAASKTI